MFTTDTRNASVLSAAIRATTSAPQPILLAGGTVLTGNAYMGDWQKADVLLGGDLVVGVGPGLLTAAEDDNMLVIDCTGCVVLPSRPDFSRAPHAGAGTLTSGQPADIAVFRIADDSEVPEGPVVNRPSHLDILLSGGRVQVWDGRAVGQTPDTAAPQVPEDPAHSYAGMWIDDTGFLHQELQEDGRYDETRGGRPHAFQGRYWIEGDRIEYLDDLGFWAFGEFRDGVLFHAGYRLTRA